jgi:cytochrome c peroxidase
MKCNFPILAAFLAVLAGSPGLAADPLRDRAKGLFEAIPATPPPLRGQQATPEKVSLGTMLYFDPRISENHDISCSTCHHIGMGGVDGRSSSIGHTGQLGGRKVLTVLNAVFNKSQFWDGRAGDLEAQVVTSVMAFPSALLKSRGGPVLPSEELTQVTKQQAIAQLKGIPGYVTAFAAAFPGEADPITYANVAKAIAAFESTLITPGAPFDRWLEGDDSGLSAAQKQGLTTFIEKGCSTCHNGINIGGGMYARFGVARSPGPEFLPSDDWGRFAITRDVGDKYVFKVPSLRNITLTAPYFHTGHSWDLAQAVAVMGEAQLDKKLTDAEIAAIVEFLESLTGRQPAVVLPVLPPRVATTPRPGQ